VVPRLAEQWRVDRVVAHRWVEPVGRERDRRIKETLKVPFELYEGEMLLAPGTLRTGAGRPFSVFTPFSRAFLKAATLSSPLAAPRSIPPPPRELPVREAAMPSLESLGIAHNPRLLPGGEVQAQERLRRFLKGPAARYDKGRNELAAHGTSRLSQDLKFGTLSVRTVWNAVDTLRGGTAPGRAYLNELLWREFSYDLLWNRPTLLDTPFREPFARFPWRDDEKSWRAWTEGRTGYPVVDAAARQLLAEGFVHNRARMVAATFLTKHLMLDYQRGEAHYLRHLTDGDWAVNNAGWQWCAGCGCDAQPYHRIFNPRLQGERFDPDGDYVRRWVPELAQVSAAEIHDPQDVPGYPKRIVEPAFARERYLAAARALASRH